MPPAILGERNNGVQTMRLLSFAVIALMLWMVLPSAAQFAPNSGVYDPRFLKVPTWSPPSTPYGPQYPGVMGWDANQEQMMVWNGTQWTNFNTGSSSIISGTTPCTGCTNGDLLGVAGGKVADTGIGAIYSAPNSNLFVGPTAGNGTATGPNNTAFGIGAGNALTIQNPSQMPAVQADAFFGYNAGLVTTTGDADVFIGYNAGAANTLGRENTFIGYNAGQVFTVGTGSFPDLGQNTFIGSLSGHATTTGASNTFVGQKSGENNTTGSNNIFIGAHSGDNLSTAANTIAIGISSAGSATTTGNYNFLLGQASGQYLNGTAANNVFVGAFSGQGTSGNPNTASANVMIGYQSGQMNTSGVQVTYVGYNAGAASTSANGSTFLGYQAGFQTTGGSNTFVGSNTGPSNTTGNNNIYIGGSSGDTEPNNATNQFVAGSGGSGGAQKITDVYFGSGYIATAPASYTVHGTGGSGANVAGANVLVAGGIGTGTGVGGGIGFSYAVASGSPSSTANTLASVGDYGITAIGWTFKTGLTLASGQLNVASMTQTAVAQSGTVCYNSGTGAVTYDSTLGCLTSTMEAKDDWRTISPREALAMVTRFEAGSFGYKLGRGLPEGPQVGLNAQQISSIDERLVGRSPDGILRGVRYQQASALYGPAIRAVVDTMAELRTDNDNLRADFDQLRRSVAR
jgi:hypothetical protein